MTSVDKELNIYLDVGHKYIQTPSGKDVRPGGNPLDFQARLNQIHSPSQRVYIFIKNYFNIFDPDITQEASFVRYMTFSGLIGGLTYGAILQNQDIRDRFIRKHNKAAFDSQHIAQRKYYDYLVSRTFSRGFKSGLHGALLTGSAGFVAFASMIYRDRVYAPDWLIGYAFLGVLDRFMLGPRGWLFGSGAGVVAATIGLGAAKSIEYISGKSIAQIRFLNHTEWLEKRLRSHDMHRLHAEKAIQERYNDMEG